MAISLVAVECFSFAQEKDWIKYDSWTITVYSPDRSYWIVIQDRNLWATMTWAWISASTWSYGYHYQWWNNHWFESCYTNGCKTFPWGETWSSTKIDASGFWPGNYYSWDIFYNAISISENWDWSSVQNDNLRWWEWDDETNWYGLTSNNPISGRQWPCPNWYHVPSIWEWSELQVIWYNNSFYDDLPIWDLWYIDNEDMPMSGINFSFSEDMLIPIAWIRRWWNLPKFGLGDGVDYIRTATDLWSSSPIMFGWDPNAGILQFQRYRRPVENMWYIGIDTSYAENRAMGLSIRCFKNERIYPETSKTLTLNVLSGENVVNTWVSFTNDEPLTSGQVLDAIDWLSNEVELATGYHFEWYADDGWVETGFDLDTAISEGTITSNLILTWKIETNKYTISFLDESGTEIMSGEFTYDQETTLPANTSTKEWYTFKWWKDVQWNTYEDGATVKNLTTENGATLEFSPIREENSKSSGGGSSWWGGRWRGSKAVNSQTDTHWSADDKESDETTSDWKSNDEDLDGLEVINYNPDLPAEQQTLSDGLTPEMHRAYKFAFKHGITTMPTILEADMFGPLDRISMAKMLSQYAINILWKTPDTSRINQFADVTPEMDAEYDNWVTLAYQLWIMWINMYNNEFRPYDLVPRSEFGTALSRMLYQTSDWEYERTDEYYVPHFNKLKEEWIMTVLDPNIEELRWYVMIMLMRSAK